VRVLNRKAIRDLWQQRMALGAIVLVMGAGVATLVMAQSTILSLRTTRDAYYERYRFGDVFASLKRAPDRVVEEVRALPGVLAVDSRVVHEVNLILDDNPDLCTGRLVSLPDEGEPILNGVHLRRGRLPSPDADDEALVSEPFAQANRLEPGDAIHAVINGRRQRLSIVGVALAPEFVYFVRAGEMLPDDRRSGALWMRRDTLERALDMEGAFNDLVVRAAPNASLDRTIADIDRLIDRYGGFGAHDRSEHVSDRYLRDEFQQLGVMGAATPLVFLGVGAFLVNMVIGRLVRAQREQIATLKAFGYSSFALSIHVAIMALVVAFASWSLGVVVGWALGADLARVYAKMFRFPELTFRLDVGSLALAAIVVTGASILGATAAGRWALRLQPAEAMRPEPPRSFRPTFIEGLGFRRLPVRTRLALRGIENHPWRSALGVVGVSFAAAVLVVSNFALDAIDFMIEREYSASQRYSSLVTFNEPIEMDARWSLAGLGSGQSALVVEPIRAAPVRLSSGHRSRRLAIMGITSDDGLMRPLNAAGEPVALPREGVLLSENLADLLGVAPGDSVVARFLDGRRRQVNIRVSGVYSGLVGLNAYMDLDALNRATGDGHVLTGAFVLEDPAMSTRFMDSLAEAPAVASVTSRSGMIESFRDTIAEHITRITVLHALFGGVIAIGVVYNTARIMLTERQRELATLRVLGFTRREVASMLEREIAIVAIAGAALGLLIGRALAWGLVRALQTESYVFPLVIHSSTYASAAAITLASAAVSLWIVRRGVARLDLLASLKSIAT
jgi:putative ABC transport system permease protein